MAKLAIEIECLCRQDLEDLYNLYWKSPECWSNEDLKKHLLSYTLMFWQMRSYKASMRDRSKHIIQEIHKKYNKRVEV